MPILEHPWQRWCVAAAAAALATGATVLLQPLLEGRAPFLLYFPALVLVGFVSGPAPGIAAMLLCGIGSALFGFAPFVPPRGDGRADLLLLAGFAIGGGVAVGIAAMARHLLQASERTRARLSMALAAGRMTTWEWDVPHGRVRFSEGAESLFGTSWTRVEDAWRLGHPEDLPRVRATLDEALRAGTHYTFVSRMVRAGDGAQRWIETHGYVHRDTHGAPWRVTGVTIDVTERQEALEASRAAGKRFAVALECSGITAWECDAQRRYTWLHNGPLGLQASDVVGRRVGDVVSRERYPAFAEAVERVFASGRGEQFEVGLELHGVPRRFLCHVQPVLDAGGRVTGLVGASLDVTETHRVQEELRLESERKDTFLATLAHELRNPMAPIRYAAATLGEGTPAAAREHARQVIQRQAAHMSRLLDDLLDMSRITRNAITLQREVVDLRDILEQAVEATRAHVEQRRHRLVVAAPDEPLRVDGDPTRLQQVLGNLLDNAAKYTDPGGRIEVRLAREGGHAVVTVKDDGLGLAPSMLREVFQLFAQPHKARGADRGGLGIGLAIVRQLVEMHGGRVAVASDGLGQGATFTVRLPLAAEAAAATPATAGAQVVELFADRLPGVLVVDDSRDAAESLAGWLRGRGWRVGVAYDGASALQACETLRPAVVLLDIGLPGMDGHAVARELRRRCAPHGVPRLVALTGWGQPQDRARSRAAGFDLHLVKPVDPVALEQSLAALLHGGDPGVSEA